MKSAKRMSLRSSGNSKNRVKIIAVAVVIFLIGAGAAMYVWYNNRKIANNTTSPTPSINYGPPTKQELQETQQFKEQLQQQATQNNNPTHTGIKTVTPVIASWGQNPDNSLNISAFIPELFEDGGTCVLTLTKDDKTATKTTTAHKDINHTSCGSFAIPYSEISNGVWNASVQYSSSAAAGKSSGQSITVKQQ